MKPLRLPARCTPLAQEEARRLAGGGAAAALLFAAAEALYPQEKVVGMSRGGYVPTVLLAPDASLADRAALWAAGALYRAARWLEAASI